MPSSSPDIINSLFYSSCESDDDVYDDDDDSSPPSSSNKSCRPAKDETIENENDNENDNDNNDDDDINGHRHNISPPTVQQRQSPPPQPLTTDVVPSSLSSSSASATDHKSQSHYHPATITATTPSSSTLYPLNTTTTTTTTDNINATKRKKTDVVIPKTAQHEQQTKKIRSSSTTNGHSSSYHPPPPSTTTTTTTTASSSTIRKKSYNNTTTPTTTTTTTTSKKTKKRPLKKTYRTDDYNQFMLQWDILTEWSRLVSPTTTITTTTTSDNSNNDNQEDDDDDDDENDTDYSLPDHYESFSDYVSSWVPLHVEETRAQILQEIVADVSSFDNNLGMGMGGGGGGEGVGVASLHRRLMNVTVRVTRADFNDDSLILSIKPTATALLIDILPTDLVVLSDYGSFRAASLGLFTSKTTANRGMVGIITQLSRKSLDMVVQVSRSLWKSYATSGRNGVEMFLMRMGSNVSAFREFKALCESYSTPLLNDILCCRRTITSSCDGGMKSSAPPISSMSLGKGFTDHVLRKFNPSQQNAISAAARGYGDGGFSLVKGPPGTGKTTTLLAILNSLYIRQYHTYYEKVRDILGLKSISSSPSQNTISSTNLRNATKSKPRILVCAPSNVAVDNIVTKIIQEGFLDANGRRCNPSIIRVGKQSSSDVKAVSLEERVDYLVNDAKDEAKLKLCIDAARKEVDSICKKMTKLRDRVQAILAATPWDVLPKQWEVRIHEESFDKTGRVYFVNHETKTTTFQMPPEPDVVTSNDETTNNNNKTTIRKEDLPEYTLYVGEIMKLIERYNTLTARSERYSLLATIQTNLQHPNNNDYHSRQLIQNVRDQLSTHILDEVHIVLTTLGSSGTRYFDDCEKFEVVVIDEAAQSVEPATLVALKLGSRHAVLVGDPQQLPATIFSVSGRNTKYDRSLFQRLEENGVPVHMLAVQYRMHPSISDFPRKIFYDGVLLDGANVKRDEYGLELRRTIIGAFPAFQPFSLLDLNSSEEKVGNSLSNVTEAYLALHLYLSLDRYNITSSSRVAIITPYGQQVTLLQSIFASHFGSRYVERVDINTVDSFQGKEANVVIVSCVRAAGSRGIGFLSDVRRMNVALTRAKYYMFVIARCKSIVVNPYWRDLVAHARERRAIVPVPIIAAGTDGGGGGGDAGDEAVVDWRCRRGESTGSMVKRNFPDLTTLEPILFIDHCDDDDDDDGYVSA